MKLGNRISFLATKSYASPADADIPKQFMQHPGELVVSSVDKGIFFICGFIFQGLENLLGLEQVKLLAHVNVNPGNRI